MAAMMATYYYQIQFPIYQPYLLYLEEPKQDAIRKFWHTASTTNQFNILDVIINIGPQVYNQDISHWLTKWPTQSSDDNNHIHAACCLTLECFAQSLITRRLCHIKVCNYKDKLFLSFYQLWVPLYKVSKAVYFLYQYV